VRDGCELDKATVKTRANTVHEKEDPTFADQQVRSREEICAQADKAEVIHNCVNLLLNRCPFSLGASLLPFGVNEGLY
jgi:hypothetical protein